MEIKKRIGLPRTQFHVMNRGARKVAIFAGDEDRALFVKLLGYFAIKHEVKIIAWCLMPNHYHLEPESEGTPLSRMMHDLDGTYAHAYNERHETTGCLFQGPFKSMGIRDSRGLAYVSRYIHANCRDLRIRPQDYRWSSCKAFLGIERVPSWLYPWPVFEAVRQPGKSAENSYKEYLDAVPRRRRSRKKEDEWRDLQVDFVRHIEERCSEWLTALGEEAGRFSVHSFVCWAAKHVYQVPPRFVQQYYGFPDSGTVSVRACRIEERLDSNPRLDRRLAELTRRR